MPGLEDRETEVAVGAGGGGPQPTRFQTKALVRLEGKWREGTVQLDSGYLRPSLPGLSAQDLSLASVLYQPRHRKTSLVFPKPAPRLLVKLSKGGGDWDGWLNGLVGHRLWAQRRFLSCHAATPSALSSALPSPSKPSSTDPSSLLRLQDRISHAKHLFLALNSRSQQAQGPGTWSLFRRSASPQAGDYEKLLHELGLILVLLQEAAAVAGTAPSAPSLVPPSLPVGPATTKTAQNHKPQQGTKNAAEAVPMATDSEEDEDSEDEGLPSATSSTSISTGTGLAEVVKAEATQKREVERKRRLGEEGKAAVGRGSAPSGGWRERLPVRSPPLAPLGLGVILKAAKEGSIPLSLSEPLSTLQRLSEMMEHAELLDKAMTETDGVMRMGLVAGFVVGAYSGTRSRVYKPFNPLLGETFGLDMWEERGWRWESEQVLHSPDVSAFHAVGKSGWRLWGSVVAGRPKPSFSYVSIQPEGRLNLALGTERLEWGVLECLLLNPASADPENRRLEYVGTVRFRCSSGLSAWLRFSRDSLHIQGQVLQGREEKAALRGVWTEWLSLEPSGPAPTRPLFKAPALPADAADYYGMGRFPRLLNQRPGGGGLGAGVAPTDSRLRPDQLALEAGELDKAQRLKRTLEAAQRRRRHSREPQRAVFFTAQPPAQSHLAFVSNGSFWPAAAQHFRNTNLPDIFAL